jgi:hypothetical protein
MLGHEPITLEPGFSPIERENFAPTVENVELLNEQIEQFLPDEWRFDLSQSAFSNYAIDTRRNNRYCGPRISIKPGENGDKGHTVFVKMGNKSVEYFRKQNGELQVTNIRFPKDDSKHWNSWCENTIARSLSVAENKQLLGWDIR